MPSLQVRDLPEPLYRKLAAEAEREHRSLAQQAVAVLARGLGMAEDPRERRRKLFERMQKDPIRFKGNLSSDDIVRKIREDRDR
jgi:hypothetical protein